MKQITKYLILFYLIKKIDKLLIKIFHINSFPLNKYKKEFSKNDSNKIEIYFKLFGTMGDLFPDLIEKLEKKRNSNLLFMMF